MKKALLFIGLALCSSFAFAQTNNYSPKMKSDGIAKITVSTRPGDLKPADYKSSIFAKDVYDTIRVWHFSDQNDASDMPVVYGNDGRVGANEIVNGTDTLAPNAQINECATWRYVPDSNYFSSQFFLQNYNSFYQAYINYCNEYLGNGQYMLIHFGGIGVTTGRPHAYMTFAPVARPADANMINIAFRQLTRKYYNTYFIDYKVNGQWRSREVNIDGIDAEINSFCTIERNYAMPTDLANQAQIEIRVRAYGSTRGNSYGNLWGLDNLAILYGDPSSMTGYTQNYIDGAYGTMPQGMNIPLTWISTVCNTGNANLTNVQAVATHILGSDTNVVATANIGNLTANTNSINYEYACINERGFINPDNEESVTYNGWFGIGMSGAYGAAGTDMSFGQHRGLPTTSLGLNKVQAKVTANGATDLKWPAMPYRVVGNTYGIEGWTDGYRWGHDNGVITTDDSYYASYVLGFTEDGQWVTDSGNFGTAGYRIMVRYNTPSNVPVDGNGQPWVLRGIEYIPSTWWGSQDLDGAQIMPVVYQDEYTGDGNSVSFNTVNTGINGNAYRVDGSSNNQLTYGYKIADENGNYNAVSYFFPEQPELTPNTSYRIGYIMASSGKFAVAASRNRTIINTDSGAYYMPLDSLQATAGYGRNFTPNQYDLYLYDPMGSNTLWAGMYDDSYPMIRAIVGPRIELPRYTISVDCNGGQSVITYVDDTVCGVDVEAAETGSPSFYIYAGNDHSVLDKLFIDGQEVVSASVDEENGDYNFYIAFEGDNVDTTFPGIGDWVLLQRDYWIYTFDDIHANHQIRATTVPAEWDIAVDPVAADVTMTLAPNPATSQVAMSLKGVSGMVNCSIIDMSGRVVYSNTINAERRSVIDLSNVPAGAYFVRINNDSFVKVEKLIVR